MVCSVDYKGSAARIGGVVALGQLKREYAG